MDIRRRLRGIRILSIDPGTTTLGWSIIDVDPESYEPLIITAGTFNASKHVKGHGAISILHGGKDERLAYLQSRVSELLETYEPNFVAAESPFLKRGRVDAFEALVETYSMLRRTLWEWSKTKKIYRITPVQAKNSVKVSHIKTTKDDVKRGVLKHLAGKTYDGFDLSKLDEHAIDAVAVGNAFLKIELLGEEFKVKRRRKAK